MNASTPTIEDRFVGSMVGPAVGDSAVTLLPRCGVDN